jgi:hemolysin activation/secretion protein
LAAGALAQTPLPPRIDPGLIQERVVPPPAPPRPLNLPELKGGPDETLPEAARSVKVTLKQVHIEGATVLPVEQLQKLATPYVGREITGAEIFELARALTAMYRNAGYILSQVIVPPQSLSSGTLTLRVIEGYVANVRVEGDPGVAATLAEIGEKIKASRPLKAGDLERYLLIANNLPGVQLRSVLAPSQTVGAADLTLIAAVKKTEGFASLDNFGSKYLGPGQLSAGIAGNQLFGDDQLSFLGVGASDSEMLFGQLSYSRVLNSEGLRLGAIASQTNTKPGDILEPFDITGRAESATLVAAYPFLRTRNESLFGRALFDYRNVTSNVLDTRVMEDNIRALRLGATWIALDRLDGSNTLDIEWSKGLGGTQAGDPLESRAGADGNFSKTTFDYERFQPIGASYGLTLGAGGQWTEDLMFTSEQFALGGRRFGRAYDPAELVGDRALAFRMEADYYGAGDARTLRSYQVYGFYDVGKVWDVKDPATGTAYSQSLASAGFGTRLIFDRNVSAVLEAGFPLTKPVASYQTGGQGYDVRIHGSLVARF